MYLIDKLSYDNGLKEAHPVEKFLFSMGALAFALITMNPVVMSILFIIMGILIVVLAGISLRDYMKLLCIPFVFILLSVITVIVEINSAPGKSICSVRLFYITFAVSMKSLVSGGTLGLKAFASVSCLYFFILTTPVSDVEYILKKMKLPVLFREMFMMIYRFIFVTVDMAERVVISQRSRGGYSSFRKGVYSIGMLASSVFVKSFFFGKASYNAMLSRGYDGELNVVDPMFRYSAVNIIMTALFYLCFIFLVIRFG